MVGLYRNERPSSLKRAGYASQEPCNRYQLRDARRTGQPDPLSYVKQAPQPFVLDLKPNNYDHCDWQWGSTISTSSKDNANTGTYFLATRSLQLKNVI